MGGRFEIMPQDRMASDETPGLAIVLSGGGARAAYQVGVLRALARWFPDVRFPIITGVSAGAINAAFLAAYAGSMAEAGLELSKLWGELHVENIFQMDTGVLTREVLHWVRSAANRTPSDGDSGLRGIVDTEPLRDTIHRAAATVDGELIGIQRNLELGRLQAIALTALNYATGQTVTWIQGKPMVPWAETQRRSLHTRITVEHVMASASLPLVFPAVRLGDTWYGDGGVRLSAPLAPALRLGANRILAVSPRYEPPSREEADRPQIQGYPPAAQILSHLLDAIFLDVLDEDVRRLVGLNRLIEKLPPEERDGMRPVEILVLRPSIDLGMLAVAYEPRLPDPFRFLARSLGSQESTTSDFLSMLMFQPDYLARLMDLGETDAEERLPELRVLLEGKPQAIVTSSDR